MGFAHAHVVLRHVLGMQMLRSAAQTRKGSGYGIRWYGDTVTRTCDMASGLLSDTAVRATCSLNDYAPIPTLPHTLAVNSSGSV